MLLHDHRQRGEDIHLQYELSSAPETILGAALIVGNLPRSPSSHQQLMRGATAFFLPGPLHRLSSPPNYHCFSPTAVADRRRRPDPPRFKAARRSEARLPPLPICRVVAQVSLLDELRKGADILVEAFKLVGVIDVFTYPCGASIEIHP
ncbi:hypothetical protein J5N97_014748 [Dioscorea zingiberensis]|uniref:Uncharacterized protein n=1 Tax=Dioscorea zingiberensis TaxID=325984 RepID=A0A9D5CUQ1_9LILI|nr:hypothetical protein J5N97_014748 [Dioscorea zingiberensis]